VRTLSRYLAIIRAIVERVERTDQMIAVGYEPKELNAIYFPVTRRPSRTASVKKMAEWIMDNYDFARAKRILDSLDAVSGDGPFLLASLSPLSSGVRSNTNGFMTDLGNASAATAELWTRHFIAVSCIPQQWNRASLERAMLEVRDYIGTIAMAGTPVITAVDTVVAWIKPKRSLASP
jgi:hypothetical protein